MEQKIDEIESDEALSRIVLDVALLEVEVDSCRNLVLDFSSAPSDMTVQKDGTVAVFQALPSLL